MLTLIVPKHGTTTLPPLPSHLTADEAETVVCHLAAKLNGAVFQGSDCLGSFGGTQFQAKYSDGAQVQKAVQSVSRLADEAFLYARAAQETSKSNPILHAAISGVAMEGI